MRSAWADEFNHDGDAAGYDRSVRNEADPIRTGYDAVLDWVVAQARVEPGSAVVDLGSGTGNLAARLPPCRELTCVDVSERMNERAREKLGHRPEVRFAPACLLEHAHALADASVDRAVSTYAVHHLPRDEKRALFQQLARALRPAGRLAFGDLMFETAAAREQALAAFRADGRRELAGAIEDEFFWDLEAAVSDLEALGLRTRAHRFSELSWGLVASSGLEGGP
jgi:putative AdoMet-dependent methyltransferase